MEKLSNNELLALVGGWSISGAIISAALNVGKFVYEAGQAFGSSLRRIGGKSLCPLN